VPYLPRTVLSTGAWAIRRTLPLFGAGQASALPVRLWWKPLGQPTASLRGKQKERIFVYPVANRRFCYGARPRFPPPPNFVPVKLARRLKNIFILSEIQYIDNK